MKTTQPRRYLVRPNQGLIKPGDSEEVTIILVDKEKQVLLNEFEQIGPGALESSKDKFLIQSLTVEKAFYEDAKASGSTKNMAETLTAMWHNVSSEKTAVTNKKLQVRLECCGLGRRRGIPRRHFFVVSPKSPSHALPHIPAQVKHTVDTASLSSATSNAAGGYGSVAAAADKIREGLSASSNGPGSEGIMPEQQFKDNANLRKKYDELVAFSVNLTAERDILNNALEQAKRDLNREMAARMSAEDSAGRVSGAGHPKSTAAPNVVEQGGKKGSKTGFSFFQLLVIATLMFFVGRYFGAKGVKMEVMNATAAQGQEL